mmetsp:Transcript_15859/g.40938  ORF Transcript_15859/g.40938 Transcript_15859/m.40938 type:complete len:353 (+) Transcript_15859:317-1375(+)
MRHGGGGIVAIAGSTANIVIRAGVSVGEAQARNKAGTLAAREGGLAVRVHAVGELGARLVAHAQEQLLIRQAHALLVGALSLALRVAGNVIAIAHLDAHRQLRELAALVRGARHGRAAVRVLASRQELALLVALARMLLLIIAACHAVVHALSWCERRVGCAPGARGLLVRRWRGSADRDRHRHRCKTSSRRHRHRCRNRHGHRRGRRLCQRGRHRGRRQRCRGSLLLPGRRCGSRRRRDDRAVERAGLHRQARSDRLRASGAACVRIGAEVENQRRAAEQRRCNPDARASTRSSGVGRVAVCALLDLRVQVGRHDHLRFLVALVGGSHLWPGLGWSRASRGLAGCWMPAGP